MLATGATGALGDQLVEVDPFAGAGPWMVRAWFGDEAMRREVAAWGDHHRIDPKGFLSIEAGPERVAALRALGYFVEVDHGLTRWIRHAERAQRAARERAARGEAPLAGIPGFPCYRTVEETFATAEAIALEHPTLATWLDVGDSWEKWTLGGLPGYDLRVLRLTNSAVPGPKPKLFVNSAIHAREYTTAELTTRFAEQLVDGYDVDADATWLLDHHEIHLLLQTNPDGRKHAEAGASWRKNTNQAYCGATSQFRGADLNRNFEFQWNCCGGSDSDPCGETFHGASPASEPEAQAVQAYLRANFEDLRANTFPGGAAPPDAPGVYFDVHSFSELVLWPWGGTATTTDNDAAFVTLGHKLAYFNGYTPQQAIDLYVTDGTTIDFGFGDLGLAAFVFELGTSFFQSCGSFESDVLPGNLPALRYAAKVVRTPYLTPSGPDALGVAVSPPVVAPGDATTVTSTIDDTRFSTVNGTIPTQPIAAAEMYVGAPPWAGGTPVPMSAVDGAFDETIEPATVQIETSSLPSGRHLVFVRGRDTLGAWGAFSSAFLSVVDPDVSPVVQGSVRDQGTGDPLPGTITIGPYTTFSGPDGAYSLQVPAGTYDLTATAPGHAPRTYADVTLVDLQTLVRDFDLAPYVAVLEDDVEDGNIGWTAQSPWAITTAQSHSPTHSWTDSPAGQYGNNADTSLTSPLVDLTDTTGVELTFWHRYATEAGYDYCHVEVSSDGGSSWDSIAAYDGTLTTWTERTFLLPQLDGAAQARIRFRLESDSIITADGCYVDDVVLRAAVDLTLFTDGFETGDTARWSSAVP